jgi:hypothetical protein
VWLAGVTAHPTGERVTQQARNVVMAMEERGAMPRYLIRDRDTEFSRAFDDVWRSTGAQIIRTPMRTHRWPTRSPNDGLARFGASASTTCSSFNRRHLERVLRIFVGHDNRHRPHRGLGLVAPDDPLAPEATPGNSTTSGDATSSAGSFTSTKSPQRDDRLLTPDRQARRPGQLDQPRHHHDPPRQRRADRPPR